MSAAGASQLAELAVVLGANVQQDQLVTVSASLGEEEMAREVAAAAYRHGARFVDVTYFDPYVKRARIEHAREETLDFVPSWYGDRMLELGRQRAARISLSGPAPPDALDGVDPERAGRDQLPFIKEVLTVVNERLVNWTVVPSPTPRWARLVYPELAEADALERLWGEIGHVCRLDEPDPVAAWSARAEELEDRARQLAAAGFDALHFEGPGTDLVVGLFPGAEWQTAREETVDGIVHMANLPSEEVLTTPDPERTEGVVRSTRPLALGDGPIVRGLTSCGSRGAEPSRSRRKRARRSCGGGPRSTRERRGSAKSRSSTGRAASVSWERRFSTPCSTRTRSATSRSATAIRR